MQLTMTVYLLGSAAGQLLIGPLSDRLGRRPMLIGGFLLFALACAGAALSTSVEALIAWRLLQALGAGVGVVGMAIVRDTYPVEGSARIIAHLGAIVGLSPALAPSIGGLLLDRFGWSSIFVVLAVSGLALAAAITFGLGESRPRGAGTGSLPHQLRHSYATLLRDRRFMAYTMCASCAFAGLFTFIAGSSYAIIGHWGVPPTHFGYVIGVLPVAFVIGSQASAALGRWLTVTTVLAIGLVLCCLAGFALLALYLVDGSLLAFLLPVAAYIVGIGVVVPQGIACTLADHPRIAGAAAALLGFVQLVVAAGVATLAAALSDGTPLTMAVTMALAGPAALLAERLAIPGRRPQPV